jgi:hypothetical protein
MAESLLIAELGKTSRTAANEASCRLLRLKSRGPWRICVQVGGGLLLRMDAEGGWNRGDIRKVKINVGLEIEQRGGASEPRRVPLLDQVSVSAFAEMIGGHVLLYGSRGPAAAGTVSVTKGSERRSTSFASTDHRRSPINTPSCIRISTRLSGAFRGTSQMLRLPNRTRNLAMFLQDRSRHAILRAQFPASAGAEGPMICDGHSGCYSTPSSHY